MHGASVFGAGVGSFALGVLVLVVAGVGTDGADTSARFGGKALERSAYRRASTRW